MIVIAGVQTPEEHIQAIVEVIEKEGLQAHVSRGSDRTIIGLIGSVEPKLAEHLRQMKGVENVVKISKSYKLASRDFHPENTVISIKGVNIGGGELVIMGGPCAVESAAQIDEIAGLVKAAGAQVLRGGAFKPRTGPYSFQGTGVEGLIMMAEAGQKHDLLTITEVMTPEYVDICAEYADILQVGTRNMQNFDLLRKLGTCGKPVLLKRGFSSTYDEFLNAAEYILAGGNPNVMLCERGIRTFETYTRNTLDLSAIPVLQQLSHLPVISDPSHGTGRRELVVPMTKASVAAGADGLIIEMHTDPDNSMTGDGVQSLFPDQFSDLLKDLEILAPAVGKTFHTPSTIA
ncbi:3-deoxy-7-phosphoheptulonate synthase [Paenibacillus peoriae]|jgi:3-deoxy-7-phosphoheptulonate synthase|uniref:3-deoxy-7-phosphoheptulonate synthase n=1 Tax=Paenibacillus polymyxa TaxID=1406 RepID=A0AAP3ZZ43_PAEPO|nr:MULTISPECIES: 3-deoxy-7-phosphoheptulonate synthase [Paenibacillus]AHC19164.1 3-deoxy-7-phosphoheptulonate synthase [Paenibacillus polymyxa CR1]APB76851.1 3-deoxy-7-phosphoheptulonate synthase [Paenibacillus polymyxa]MBO3283876.1 3-deoxy-7-phosphoheptulonate synthase [Paenibacillus polymyxa]MBP1175386.1 3-deoxy-7-phosphoheptulonate synthase [Paenibacillus sp. PvR133]MBP1311088.1 3-deoxy-7-phosphoheptulonate synthase [Paenibacillus sp. 1182]